MKTRLRFALLSVFLSVSLSARAQDYGYWNFRYYGRDTTIVEGEYSLHFRSLSGEEGEIIRVNRFADTDENDAQMIAERRKIYDLDSVVNLLRGQVQFDCSTYTWDEGQTSYVSSIVCRNGMKIVFQYAAQFLRYYPDEKILLFNNWNRDGSRWAFRVEDGEYDYELEEVAYSKSRRLRTLLLPTTESDDGDKSLVIQARGRHKQYTNIFDFNYFDIPFYEGNSFWKGDCLFIYFGSGWWEVVITRDRSYKPEDHEA